MELCDEQIEAFRSQGYLNLGVLFDEEELATIAREYDRFVRKESQVLGDAEQGVFPYRAMLNFRSPELQQFILHPGLVGIAQKIVGEDVRFWWDQGINKSPGAGSPIAWHQDNGYQPGRTQEFLTCWLALDSSDRSNGGLQVIPGSHAGGHREHRWDGVHAVIPSGELDTGAMVDLDVGAGELLIFSSLLVHQTLGNRTSDRQRRSWVIQYCRGDQHNEVTGEIYDNRPWVLKSGKAMDELKAERPFNLVREHA